ncbi:MAG: cytochrome c3 family protein [Desulfuromonadaceae bacterium]|nr:cytochrome c3 family protein [Desulfuromonadaceae bacterium]
MPFSAKLSLFTMLSLFLLILQGCGEKTVVAQGGAKIEQSQACIDCHQGVVNPVTGKLIVEEWKLSHHNTFNGAGCADCHEPEPGHPTGCNLCHNGTPAGSLRHVSNNPDRDSKCDKCHGRSSGLFPTSGAREAHFNTITSVYYPGSYVSSQYVKNCRKCHNPHDTSSTRNNLKDWATSSHGTVSGFSSFRTAARDDFDFKTAGSFALKASQALSDSTNGTYQTCLRCHTTTGFVNYVNSGLSDLSPFGVNDPKTGKPYRMDDYPSGPTGFRSKISSDKSKELTSCDACHDNGSGSAYGYKLRLVQRITTYYNFSSSQSANVAMKGGPAPISGGAPVGGAIRGFGLTFPDVGASNTCVACHSGRMTGLNVKMADIRGLELEKAGRIVNHFRGAAEMLFRPVDKNGTVVGAGFEFYSSNSSKLQNYNNVAFTHDIIGTSRTNPLRTPEGTKGLVADNRGYGPCIGCHMNANGKDGTSHTFLPVNRNASSTFRNGSSPSDPITGVTSKACAACHTDTAGVMEWDVSGIDPASGATYNLLELQKIQYKAAVKAFARLLAFAVDSRVPSAVDIVNPLTPTNTSSANNRVWVDSEGRPGTPANWYGSNTDGKVRLQKWLRTNTTQADSDNTLLNYFIPGAEFTDPLTGSTYQIRSAAYSMGAAYNFYMLYYDPGAFAHNRRYVKRLIFDSMDWLDDGKLNKSVCDAAAVFTRAGDSKNRQYPRLNTYGGAGLTGDNDTFMYGTYLTDSELKQASYYLCGSVVTGNNADGTIKTYTTDHRPAP